MLFLFSFTNNEVKKSDNILKITINLPNESGELFVFYSTDNDTIGKISNPYIQGDDEDSIACNLNAFEEDHIYIISEHTESSHELIMLHPINFTGDTSYGQISSHL